MGGGEFSRSEEMTEIGRGIAAADAAGQADRWAAGLESSRRVLMKNAAFAGVEAAKRDARRAWGEHAIHMSITQGDVIGDLLGAANAIR